MSVRVSLAPTSVRSNSVKAERPAIPRKAREAALSSMHRVD
jgi:hypothetical protein